MAVERTSGNNVALKCLQNHSEEKEQRFRDEVNIIRDNLDVGGIIPILDYDLDNLWYTMPIADPIMKVTQGILKDSPAQLYHIGGKPSRDRPLSPRAIDPCA